MCSSRVTSGVRSATLPTDAPPRSAAIQRSGRRGSRTRRAGRSRRRAPRTPALARAPPRTRRTPPPIARAATPPRPRTAPPARRRDRRSRRRGRARRTRAGRAERDRRLRGANARDPTPPHAAEVVRHPSSSAPEQISASALTCDRISDDDRCGRRDDRPTRARVRPDDARSVGVSRPGAARRGARATSPGMDGRPPPPLAAGAASRTGHRSRSAPRSPSSPSCRSCPGALAAGRSGCSIRWRRSRASSAASSSVSSSRSSRGGPRHRRPRPGRWPGRSRSRPRAS